MLSLKKRLLTDFDHEEEHLKRLQIYFQELTFDEWLQQHHETSDAN